MKFNTPKTLTTPIVLASITVLLSIFVLIGWIYVLLQNQELSQRVSQDWWLMSAGILSLIVIATVVILLSLFLGREIIEGQQQTRFIDSVTHELKSPLASLKLAAQTLNRKDLKEEHKDNLCQIMIDDIDRLSFFIDDILTASLLSDGYNSIGSEKINIKDVLNICSERVKNRYSSREGTIEMRVNNNLYVQSNRTSLEMILRNLIDNAIKYSDPPYSIDIKTVVIPPTNIAIHIKDRGIGISYTQQKSIFRRFYRATTVAVRKRKGTGIGLYVVEQLVKNIGATISVHSDGIDKGSEFIVSLPRDQKLR